MAKNEEDLNDQGQFKYRSAVGILLLLLKYPQPDIAHTVRELSKVNNKTN